MVCIIHAAFLIFISGFILKTGSCRGCAYNVCGITMYKYTLRKLRCLKIFTLRSRAKLRESETLGKLGQEKGQRLKVKILGLIQGKRNLISGHEIPNIEAFKEQTLQVEILKISHPVHANRNHGSKQHL